MLFGLNTLDKTIIEYLTEIESEIQDNKTLLILDTNIIAYLYKLHHGARDEFYKWTNLLKTKNRLVIPAWAANEYFNRVKENKLNEFTTKSKNPEQVKKSLEEMTNILSLYLDDKLLLDIGKPASDRSTFLNSFRSYVKGLDEYLPVLTYSFSPEDIHQEIIKNLSDVILKSSITDLCNRASLEAGSRFEHRLPPAYMDEGKPKNKYGDLIIWFELLEHSKANIKKYSTVIFLTNDIKADWVYAPQNILFETKGKRKSIPNKQPTIKIIDPRLVLEFENYVGHANIRILDFPTLVQSLSQKNPTNYEQLASAIQADVDMIEIDVDNSGVESKESTGVVINSLTSESDHELPELGAVDKDIVTVESTKSELETTALTYSSVALQDATYLCNLNSKIDGIIEELKSHNWYIQNPAINKIISLNDEHFSSDSWFVLGRNVYQAADGNSQRAFEFVDNLEHNLHKFSDAVSIHLLAGIVYEIYFDRNGEFRDRLKVRFFENPLKALLIDKYESIRSFLTSQLSPHIEKLSYIPGTKDSIALDLKCVSECKEVPSFKITSVLINGKELLKQIVQNSSINYWAITDTKSTTPIKIKRNVSNCRAIIYDLIELKIDPSEITIDQNLNIDDNYYIHYST